MSDEHHNPHYSLTMAYSSDDFGSEEIEQLLQQRVFLTPAIDGKRRVSAAAFAPPQVTGVSSSSSSSSSSTASFAVRGFAPVPQGATVNFPCAADSPAGLEFIGFTSQAAEEIFTRWSARPDPDINPDQLLDYAFSYVRSKDPSEASPGRETMTRMGISNKMQDALTDPAFADVAATETQQFWIRDTLQVNYASLHNLQARLKKIAKSSKAKGKGKAVTQPPPGPPFIASSVPTTTASFNVDSEHFNLPAAHVALGALGPIFPDHYVLYKGKAAAEMDCFIEADGSINMDKISTSGGGDFNHRHSAWYFTPEFEVAEKYRVWAERRCEWSETWLIRIQVPKAMIHAMRSEELWYSPDWKEYVWYCRKKTSPPLKFNKYWLDRSLDLMKGHICQVASTPLTRIKKEEVQSKMNEGMLLYLANGAKATQWVFLSDGSVAQLGEEMRGKVHIDITAPATSQGK